MPKFRLTAVHIFALCFVVWLFSTNVEAALFAGTRNWAWTFVQLGILLLITSILLFTEEQHQHLMLVFGFAAAFSAILGYLGYIGNDAARSGGLSGINSAARYYIVALIMFTYLVQDIKAIWLKMLSFLAMLSLLAGIVSTGSRTGFIIAVAGIILVLLFKGSGNVRWRIILVGSVVVTILFLAPDAYWERIATSRESLLTASDTVGTRFELWDAGIRMWQANPIKGIGVGQFPLQLRYFSRNLIVGNSAEIGAHNMYVAVLAETGIVGFLLFMAMLISGLVGMWRYYRAAEKEDAQRVLTWIVILAVLMFGGITKHDQYDKLLWFVIGASATFPALLKNKPLEKEETIPTSSASLSRIK